MKKSTHRWWALQLFWEDFAPLACNHELHSTKQSKETNLPWTHASQGSAWSKVTAPHTTQPHAELPLARADIDHQVCKVVSKVLWRHHFGSCISIAFLLLAPATAWLSASLGIFFLYFGKQCRNALWYLRPRPFRRGLEYNLMLHGSRWQVCCICGRHGCQGGTLKISHYYRYKRSHSTSYSEDEKSASYFTTSSMQHRLGLFKNIVFSGLD